MMWVPSVGDCFYHPPETKKLTCDRRTRAKDGARYIWSGGVAHPLFECWSPELLDAFVYDLSHAESWGAVELITCHLPPGGKELIWSACPPDVKAQVAGLRPRISSAAAAFPPGTTVKVWDTTLSQHREGFVIDREHEHMRLSPLDNKLHTAFWVKDSAGARFLATKDQLCL